MTWEEEVAAAEASGHTFENDPTHALSSVTRVTCKVCQSSMLMTSSGYVYGSATEMSCAEAREALAALGAFLEGAHS